MGCIVKECMVKKGMAKTAMGKEDMAPSRELKNEGLKGDDFKGDISKSNSPKGGSLKDCRPKDDSHEEDAVKSYYAYMLRCADGTLYSGYTNNLARRLANHNKGRGAKYTRSRLPVQLAYYEELMGKSAAMRREAELKRLTRAQKEALIKGKNNRLLTIG